MQETALEVLGRLIAQEIRDNTIRKFDQYLRGEGRGQYAKAVWALYEEHQDDSKALLEAFTPVIVDETIGIFLQVLDEYLDRVVIQVDEGEKLKSPYAYTDALEAEYRPEDGWIATYSQERPDMLYLAYRGHALPNMRRYALRWQTENLHAALKTRGFNLEDTGLTRRTSVLAHDGRQRRLHLGVRDGRDRGKSNVHHSEETPTSYGVRVSTRA